MSDRADVTSHTARLSRNVPRIVLEDVSVVRQIPRSEPRPPRFPVVVAIHDRRHLGHVRVSNFENAPPAKWRAVPHASFQHEEPSRDFDVARHAGRERGQSSIVNEEKLSSSERRIVDESARLYRPRRYECRYLHPSLFFRREATF